MEGEVSTGSPPRGQRAAAEPEELRLVTAMFADIVGSTALGEFLSIEEVQALVGECISRMCEAIERHSGAIGAYMGDGIAAFFGLEAADEGDQARAALAALDIRDVVAQYANEARSTWGVDELNVRIGINSGRVATGAVGASDPKILALGDAINIAARLQALAEPGSIVVGPSVARTLEGKFELRSLGLVEVRGREELVDAHVLVAESIRTDFNRKRPMIGRDTELARLQARLSELVAGRGQVVVILGEAGIGKSRLLDAMRTRASGVQWLGVAANRPEQRIPYEPFVGALRAWLALPPGASDLATRVRLHARLTRAFGSAGEELLAPLGRLLGLPPRTKADRRLDGLPVEVLRASLHRAYGDWLQRLARTGPVVMAVDNFDLVDETTVSLGAELLSLTDVSPILFVVTMRADPKPASWDFRIRALSEFMHRTDEFQITALSDDDAEELVGQLDVGGALSGDVRMALVRRAEGNPLYLEELFNAVTGRIADTESGEIELLPPALEALLVSRIDRLPAHAREVLQSAAILGREFSKDLLKSMAPEVDVDAALTTLLRTDVIRERRRDPAEFTFKHGLLRNAALTTLTERKRRALHERAATAIESSCGPNLREHAPALAWHYVAAEDTAKAARFLEELGDRLAALYRYDRAAEVLDDCRTYLREHGSPQGYSRVTEKLVEVRARAGDTVGALQLVDDLLVDASEREARRLHALKASIALQGGRLHDASEELNASRDGVIDHELLAKSLALSAQVALRMGDVEAARTYLDGLDNVDGLTADASLEVASAWAGLLAAVGDFVAARGWGERAVDLARRVGRLSAELRAQRNLGVLEVLNGRVSSGHGLLRQAFDTCMDLSFPIGALESGINLIHSACLLGRLDEAERVGDLMLRLTDSPYWQAMVQSNLATTRFELNDLDGARQIAERVLAAGPEVTSSAPRIAVRLALIRVHMAERDWSAADEQARAALDEVGGLRGREGLAIAVRTAMGEVALARGDTRRALRLAEAGLQAVQYAEKPVHLALLRLRASAIAVDCPDEARSILEDVQNLSRVMELRLEEGRTLVATGLCTNAEEALADAEALFAECGCARGLAEVAEARRQVLTA